MNHRSFATLPAAWRRRFAVLGLVLALTMVINPLIAQADPVVNNIDTTIDPALESRTISVGGSTVVGFYIQPSNVVPPDDASGCNAPGSNPATVSIAVPDGVVAEPASLTFVGCGVVQDVTFSSSTPGSYLISVSSVTGGKDGSLWDTAPASFTLVVSPPSDSTAPASSIALNPAIPNGDNGWYTTDVRVAVSATDEADGSGVAETRCVVDPPTAPTSFDEIDAGCAYLGDGAYVTTDGSHTVYAASKDNAGNVETPVKSATFKIDRTAPTISHNAAADDCDEPGNAGWCKGTQTASFTASDATSGLADLSKASFVQSTTTNGSEVYVASGEVCDQAGNCNPGINAGPYKIDSVAPSIIITAPAEGGAYLLNAVVASSYSCDDLTSGTATCSGPVANGTNFDTGAVGPHTFTVNATDVAGNSSSAANNYSVQYATSGMCLGAPGHAILQPINPDGYSVFKRGSTVPAKFRVCDANGVSIGTPGVVSSFKLVGTSAGTVAEAGEDVSSTTPDAAFRWDATAQQWIFNMSSKSLTANVTYLYRITLNDGTHIDFQFGLK